MIAIQYDAVTVIGNPYSPQELLQMATAMYIYAFSKGKTVTIDPDTKMVIIK